MVTLVLDGEYSELNKIEYMTTLELFQAMEAKVVKLKKQDAMKKS